MSAQIQMVAVRIEDNRLRIAIETAQIALTSIAEKLGIGIEFPKMFPHIAFVPPFHSSDENHPLKNLIDEKIKREIRLGAPLNIEIKLTGVILFPFGVKDYVCFRVEMSQFVIDKITELRSFIGQQCRYVSEVIPSFTPHITLATGTNLEDLVKDYRLKTRRKTITGSIGVPKILTKEGGVWK